MAVNASNIILEPCDVYIGRREKTTVLCVADSSGSLNNLYFTLGTAGNATATHYVWLNVNSAGTDPAPTGLTGIEVAVATDASAATVAAAVQAAVEAIDGFNTKVSSATVTIENAEIGLGMADDAGSTGFTITQVVEGSKSDLGGTSGGITLSPEVSKVEVKADQTGEQLLDEINNGVNATIAMSLSEVTADKWSTIVGQITGDETTPASGTKVVGFGESKRFTNLTSYSFELVLKPSNSSDDLRNITFWKTTCTPSSVNFSGSDLQVMEVEFKAYRDTTRNTAVNLMAFGDVSNNLLV